VRALLVTNYNMVQDDYSSVRRSLAAKAWSVVRTGADLGLYLDAYSFPRWNSTEDMWAFAPIQEKYDVTGESPIADWISTDVNQFLQEEKRLKRLERLLLSILSDSELTSLFIWIGSCDELPSPRTIRDTEATSLLDQCTENGLQEDIAFHVT